MSTDTKWVIDNAHSTIAFKIKHLMISNVKGVFKDYDASIYTTGSDFLTAEIDFWMNPASIDTGDAKRDGHLTSADFFDVENYKEITFKTNTIEKAGEGDNYTVWGDLTIKGITKRIKLEVEFNGIVKDPLGNEKAGFALLGKVNRKDWNLHWNAVLEAGGVLISEEVKLECEIELTKAAIEA